MGTERYEPYTVNVSSVQDFSYCPFRWVCKWVENRVPRNEPRAFRFGKLFHRLFEWHLGEGLSMEAAIQAAREEWIAECRDKDPNSVEWADAVEDLEMMAEPFMLWKDSYPFEVPVVEIEQPYVFPFPGDDSILIRMRPDRVGIRGGKLWHVQHKALGATKNFQNFIVLQQRSYHEHIYAEGLIHKYSRLNWRETLPFKQAGMKHLEYGGTHFDLYRKLKYRRKPTLKQLQAGEKGAILNTVDRLFWQHPMTIDLQSGLHKHVVHCLHDKIVQMREVERRYREEGVIPSPNEDRNGGYYGGVPDEYFYVLIGETDLSDNTKFKDREDTYANPDTA